MYTLVAKNTTGLYVREAREWDSPDHPELRKLEEVTPSNRRPLVIAVKDFENAIALLNHLELSLQG